MKEKVAFRKGKNSGDVFALFPYQSSICGTLGGAISLSFDGKFIDVDYLETINLSIPATSQEYISLLNQLNDIWPEGIEPIHVDFEGNEIELDEAPLPDDYPVYGDYLYVCDGKIVRCDLFRGTVADLKRDVQSHHGIKVKEVTTCDIVGRRKMYKW